MEFMYQAGDYFKTKKVTYIWRFNNTETDSTNS